MSTTMTSITHISLMIFGILQLVNCTFKEESQVVQELSDMMNETAILINVTNDSDNMLCIDKEDGIYRNRSSCTLYYECTQKQIQAYQCLTGLQFSQNSGKCENSSVVQCGHEHDSGGICYNAVNGLHPNHSTSCHQYYRCENGSLTDTYYCEQGFSFSVIDQACLPSNEVLCIDITCSQTNGYFVIPGTKCEAYYSCNYGMKLYGLCPINMIFDVKRQICTPQKATCYEPVCTGRVNGFYADTSHECRRAFHCFGGSLNAIMTCPEGYLHNGTSCEPSYSVICQSPESTAVAVSLTPSDICNGLADGSYSSLDPDCRGYFLCRNERYLTTLYCAPGLRFDGRRCVERSDFPCLPSCSSRPNGIYVDPSSHCRSYYYCLEGEIVSQKTCPSGTIHNGHMCVPSELTTCPITDQDNKCKGLTDGNYTDYSNSCRSYFTCFAGLVKQKTYCDNDKVWNGYQCVTKDKFVCKGPKPWIGCNTRQSGMYQDGSPASLCRHYYYCSGGNRTDLSCPDSYIFNGNSCVPSHTYSCPQEELNPCSGKQDGYHQDFESGCRSYFYCSSGHAITYVCPHSHVFNGSKCVSSETYQCPSLSRDCKNRTNGYHYDVFSKCHKYFYCLEGEKVIILSCAKNKIFNGHNCVEPSEFECPKSHVSSNDCKSKPNGKYPDLNTRCTHYFQCINGRKTNTYSCSDGNTFNGTCCVNSNYHEGCNIVLSTKQIEPNSDCSNAHNGFYQNYTSGCHTYYYCIDGVKTTLSCPGNDVFNGQICVDQKLYTCPSPPMSSSSFLEMKHNIKRFCQNYSILYLIFFPFLKVT